MSREMIRAAISYYYNCCHFKLLYLKIDQIHTPDSFVRNFYFFRRNFSPQLSLLQMEPREAVKLLEKAVSQLFVKRSFFLF